jgi:hypothetical protein
MAYSKSVHDVQVFLGFANFYRSFIKDYSSLTVPLTNLLKKNKKFIWDKNAQSAFDNVKKSFCSKPILAIFNSDRGCVMETDASDFALGSVLNQYDDNNVLHPIAYYSRKFNEQELNYEIYDKEMLSIVDSFIHWRQYLECAVHKTLVLSDHKNLEYFLKTRKLNRRQARWSIKLSSYNFVIQYRSAKQNSKADALSRRPDLVFSEGDKQPIHSLLKPNQLILSATHSVRMLCSVKNPK